MNDEEIGAIYSDMGYVISEDIKDSKGDIFLYAEAQPGVISASIFIDVGDRIVYREASDELFDMIRDAWEGLEEKKRWSTLSYTISGKRFSADFQFPEEIDQKESQDERRDRILREKYGQTPIDFSEEEY